MNPEMHIDPHNTNVSEACLSIFDLHVHTVKGSSDSSLTPDQLVSKATLLGLSGVCLTEHSGGWEQADLDRTFKDAGLAVFRALEVDTDMGHILVFGMNKYVAGMHRASDLRKAVDHAGGVMVSAHPFRNLFNRPPYNTNLLFPSGQGTPESAGVASEHPLFKLVDEIEVINGSNTQQENEFASEVAANLGFTGIGGSDVHSAHGLGRGVTIFQDDITSESELVSALKEKRFEPGIVNSSGEVHKIVGPTI